MPSSSRLPIILLFFSLVTSAYAIDDTKEFVLTLDQSNFTQTVTKHDFLVVDFYAPWCGHCKELAPEYETAASILSSNNPPITLAKVDANDEKNKDLATEYDIKSFPTLKIIKDGGKTIQDYKGPRDAQGIVAYLKKQVGPASTEIKSTEDASDLINGDKIVIVGIFPELCGDKFNAFLALAEKLRSDYDFAHTLDAKLLPRGDSSVTGPIVRLFKPFDELVVDFEDFNLDALEKFVEEASTPTVTVFDSDPKNHPYLIKFFGNQNTKFFGLKEDHVPVIVINNDKEKYVKPNVEPDHIESWLKEYKEGKIAPYVKSEPVPESNDQPVKVVVADNFDDIVFKSGKNVLLELYAPWCGHCKKLSPILDKVAASFAKDKNVVIAKMDASANDIVHEEFEVKGYPTLYFKSASGKLSKYSGKRSKEKLIDFIKKNKDESTQKDSGKEEL
ncbi:hypothetical protein M8C21_014388 [Ambrosia artemisiifolia]|uniref:protein disulfide-isomerase n=1 Tax=Ambrosia artemisiifolia TaxID=4212 RepID=A0AAD5DCA0_AMBAR|nr:hypothetical protein M8C21_014388 [Ambrosia artemisiifolia]